MERLSGLDASFLYAETESAHMHTLKVLVLELPERARGAAFAHVRRGLEQRLHVLRPLRFTLAQDPLGIGHPVWVEDPSVAARAHLEHAVLPPHAESGALEAAIGAFASVPLAREAPLWKLLVIEGLPEGRVALVIKIHHALADGSAAARLMSLVMGEDPPGPSVPRREARAHDAPSGPQLLREAFAERARQLRTLAPLAIETAQTFARARHRERELSAQHEPHLFGGARTHFDQPLTSRRAVALARLDLGEVKRIRSARGASVNDVVLGIAAGGLRRYLHARGERVDRPLVAAVPVGLRDGPHPPFGNHLSNLVVPLHVEIDDPVARLAASSRSASNAKTLHEVLGPDLLERWTRLARPALMRWLWHDVVRRVPRSPVNVVISNVPGPQRELWVGGARLTDLHSIGPLLETTGLNLTFWSYAGRLNASVVACPDHGTDVSAVARALRDAADELGAAPREDRDQVIR